MEQNKINYFKQGDATEIATWLWCCGREGIGRGGGVGRGGGGEGSKGRLFILNRVRCQKGEPMSICDVTVENQALSPFVICHKSTFK